MCQATVENMILQVHKENNMRDEKFIHPFYDEEDLMLFDKIECALQIINENCADNERYAKSE